MRGTEAEAAPAARHGSLRGRWPPAKAWRRTPPRRLHGLGRGRGCRLRRHVSLIPTGGRQTEWPQKAQKVTKKEPQAERVDLPGGGCGQSTGGALGLPPRVAKPVPRVAKTPPGALPKTTPQGFLRAPPLPVTPLGVAVVKPRVESSQPGGRVGPSQPGGAVGPSQPGAEGGVAAGSGRPPDSRASPLGVSAGVFVTFCAFCGHSSSSPGGDRRGCRSDALSFHFISPRTFRFIGCPPHGMKRKRPLRRAAARRAALRRFGQDVPRSSFPSCQSVDPFPPPRGAP
jgi:hypothetical protein